MARLKIIQMKQKFLFFIYYLKIEIIDKNILSSNQIVGFLDHQYFWKERINGLIFL